MDWNKLNDKYIGLRKNLIRQRSGGKASSGSEKYDVSPEMMKKAEEKYYLQFVISEILILFWAFELYSSGMYVSSTIMALAFISYLVNGIRYRSDNINNIAQKMAENEHENK